MKTGINWKLVLKGKTSSEDDSRGNQGHFELEDKG